MFEGLWALVGESLKQRGYTEEEILNVIHAMKHLDWKFVLDQRKKNKKEKFLGE